MPAQSGFPLGSGERGLQELFLLRRFWPVRYLSSRPFSSCFRMNKLWTIAPWHAASVQDRVHPIARSPRKKSTLARRFPHSQVQRDVYHVLNYVCAYLVRSNVSCFVSLMESTFFHDSRAVGIYLMTVFLADVIGARFMCLFCFSHGVMTIGSRADSFWTQRLGSVSNPPKSAAADQHG